MRRVAHVADVHEAIALAVRLRDERKYDWFRGQAKNYPLAPSLARRTEPERQEALEKLGRFEAWVHATPGLEELAAGGADHLLAVAQHYGIPTQFLDFTTAPEIAGFFACDSEGFASDQQSCIICLNTGELADFWRDIPAEWPPPEFLRIDVPNLWRLQAQQGLFLFCPYTNIEKYYKFDRIIFQAKVKACRDMRDRMYPTRKSQMEVLLDHYFMNELLIEGDRRMVSMTAKMTVHRIDPPPEGIDTELARPWIPPLASWRTEAISPWRSTRDERLANVLNAERRRLEADLTDAPASTAAHVASQVTAMMSRGDAPRGALVEWKCDFSPNSAAVTGAAELEAALDWLWDGLRALPCSDQDLAIGMGNCVGLSAAHATARRLRPEPGQDYAAWQDAANAVLGAAVHVGFDGADGSYSLGYAAKTSLLECVREDVTDYIQPGFRDQIVGNVIGLMQAIHSPDKLFEFEPLARVFARQIAPTQVLTRSGRAVFFSPARINSLGLA
jgi:FRG domain-containing protein